jgi:hypothetical protein
MGSPVQLSGDFPPGEPVDPIRLNDDLALLNEGLAILRTNLLVIANDVAKLRAAIGIGDDEPPAE